MDTITRMRAFVAVVEAGGFSAAARGTGRSKALMSRYVAELEEELGARLLNRNTRQISLTEAGETAYEEAQEILRRVGRLRDDIEASTNLARGRLRVSAPRTLGDGDLSRAVMEFLVKYPDLRMELSLEDRFVDLVNEGYDAAIRISALEDSSLIARRLADFRIAVCATPNLVAAGSGRPHHPAELAELPCVIDTNVRSRANWPFRDGDKRISVAVSGRVEASSPHAIAAAARAGLGFARLPLLLVQQDIAAGRLVRVLQDFEADELGIFVVYPHRERMPAKLRVFIDHMAEWFEAERKAGRTC
jgi:DNA-binding transcriptional LysR family regulator